MKRVFVYPTEQPRSQDWLNAEVAKMIALGYLSQGVLGTNTVVDGLACIPTTPLSLAVQIGPGSIYQQEPVDQNAFSSLPIDTVDQIIKQGISLQPVQLTLVPPGTSGQAINYLIEASFNEVDTGSTVLPYFDSAIPTLPFSGPAGSGTSQPVFRDGQISLVAKSGAAATAGSQVTPTPDPGYVGLWVVTVANGATQLTSAQISQYPAAPFILVKLPQLPYWVQQGTFWQVLDTGTANAMAVAPIPVPSVPPANLFVKKISSPNTGAMTITIAGQVSTLGPFAVINADASAIISGEIAAGYLMHLNYDGTAYRFLNGSQTTAVGSLTASAGEGIAVSGGGVISLNFPGLSNEPAIALVDLFAFYSIADGHHRVETWAQLIANLLKALQVPTFNFQKFSGAGTYTYTPNPTSYHALAIGTGPGGGGSGATGSGGSSGATALAFFSLVGLSPQTVTIGAGGLGGPSGSNGNPGAGPTTLGTLLSAGPGPGGTTHPTGSSQPGGVATVGTLLLPGNPGLSGITNLPSGYFGGNGGPSFWGGAGVGADDAGLLLPGAGFFGGGGGGGFFAGQAGGKGGDGLVVILEI